MMAHEAFMQSMWVPGEFSTHNLWAMDNGSNYQVNIGHFHLPSRIIDTKTAAYLVCEVISPLKCNMKFISILTGAPPVVVLLFAFLAFVHDKIMNNSIMWAFYML